MGWSSILAPLAGAVGDAEALRTAAALAARFDAELCAVYTPPDAAGMTPWTGEGLLGAAQVSALEGLRAAAEEGEARARAALGEVAAARTRFTRLDGPVWASLCAEARFCDVAVFGPEAGRGRGLLADAFQQVLMEERRPVLVRRGEAFDRVVVAWDGGREATRAARAALPLLSKASQVTVVTAPDATPRRFDPRRLQAWFQRNGVDAATELLTGAGEPGPLVAEAALRLGAEVLVAGAFGHPRFQRFVFGGATRALLATDEGPSLFLAH